MVAVGISIALVLTAAFATPFARLPLPAVPGYMTAFGAAMIVINLLLAAFLFSKGAIEDREDAVRLGTAYFFIAAIFVPLTAAFPGGFMPNPVIGTAESAVWLWCCWHLGFGLAILRYATLARPAPGGSSVLMPIAVVLALVLVAALISTVWIDQLPATLRDDQTLFSGWTASMPLSILALLVIATVAVARLRARTPEQVWLTVGMVAACVDVWLTYCGSERFSLGWYLAKFGSVFTSLTVMISLFHDVTRLYSRLAVANAALRDLAGRDGLTGLFNRRHLDAALAMEWLRAHRERVPISVLMIDVDHFKGFNDTYGHQEGDACLRRLAAVLVEATRRPADLAARYGGEEFLLCLPGTSSEGALEVAYKIRAAVRDMAIPHAASTQRVVTVSIGLAGMVPQDGETSDELVAAADTGLYRAKSAGRDRVMQADVRRFQLGDAIDATIPLASPT
ncbi:MAG TPA: GGDEF domain-containing protein [Aliidongia sp.]|uniref:sensor domain-containing diguanylate cyclase n=1 Tax=Aliidongia sp. TaxID=1914230 RepID=UPI002DDD09A3|nr:GGDEF domain-containing protein [Aliidongia sp.]HEV2673470.1 GGDEF domain-containing protein [Aliidongia sp.]